MDNNIKHKLKKIKNFLEKKEKLSNMYEKKQEDISEKLWELGNVQSKLYEYNDCKRNSHIGVGFITAILAFFMTKNILDQELVNSILITIGVASTSTIGTHSIVKHKINKLKKENPEIDFENSNFDENEKKRLNLLKKQMEYSKKISEIKDMNKKCVYCLEELDSNENISSLKACEILNDKNICKKEKPKEKQKILTIE